MSRKMLVWITRAAGREESDSARGSGAVSVTASAETTSPRSAPGQVTREPESVDLQDGQEGLLRYLHRTHLLHPLLSFLLLLEKLSLAADVAAIALREHVLAERLHRRARDHLLPDRRLDDDLEELARNQLLQLVGDLPPPVVRLVLVDDHGKGIDRVAVDQHVEPDEVARAIFEHLVVEAGIAAADRLQAVEEVEDDLAERKFPVELDARRVEVCHVLVHAAPLRPERHDRPDVLGGRHDA